MDKIWLRAIGKVTSLADANLLESEFGVVIDDSFLTEHYNDLVRQLQESAQAISECFNTYAAPNYHADVNVVKEGSLSQIQWNLGGNMARLCLMHDWRLKVSFLVWQGFRQEEMDEFELVLQPSNRGRLCWSIEKQLVNLDMILEDCFERLVLYRSQKFKEK